MVNVVTGASGHLGANLVRALLHRGSKVRALVHRDPRAIEGLAVERIAGDILDLESLVTAFRSADVVYHLAARISIVGWDRRQVEVTNVTGVGNVIRACRIAGVRRLVHVSSFHAMRQHPLDTPLDESRPLLKNGATPPYDRSKAEGETLVLNAVGNGLDAVIVSPTGMLGPYDFRPSHFGAVLLSLAKGRFPGLVNAGLDWVDVRDVAEGVISAAERARPGEKYLLSGNWASMVDIALRVSLLTGQKPPRLVAPLRLARTLTPLVTCLDRVSGRRPLMTSIALRALESNRNVSHAKATRDLDYQPRNLAETLSDTVDWFGSEGLLKT